MKSIARNQFPITAWKEGKRVLWNPIHKKALKNRPEERVRLRILEYLLQAGWSRHRITTEEAIRDYADEQLRTDIICYSKGFEPQLLIECKAENVPLTSETAEQVGRYNRNVGAPFLLISNGRSDHWYEIHAEEEAVKKGDSIPGLLSKPEPRSPDYEYWKKRGFAGGKAQPALRKWLNPVLKSFSSNRDSNIRYLQFNKTPTDLELNHYYYISELEHSRIALSFLNTEFGGTRMIAILNQEGTNRAVAEINLDLVFDRQKPNSSIYSAEGVQNFDIRLANLPLFSKEHSKVEPDTIARVLGLVFNDHLDL